MKFDKDKWRKEQVDKKEKVKQTLKDISTNFNEVIDNIFKKFVVCANELEKILEEKELENENLNIFDYDN